MTLENRETSDADDMSARAREQLRQHFHRIQNRQICFKIWQDYLTDEERNSAGGDLSRFVGHGGTVALWMTVRRVSFSRSIIEVAQLLGLPPGEAQWLLRSIGEPPTAPASNDRPCWNPATYELLFRGHAARTIKRPREAVRIIAILESFEIEGWPPRIDDPLPPDEGGTRLASAIKSLNRGLVGMRFRADGDDGVRWEPQ